MVYDDAEKLYAEVRKDGKALLEDAFKVLFPNSQPLTSESKLKSVPSLDHIVAFNTTFFPRQDIVEIPLGNATSGLKSQIVQASKNGTGYAIMDCAGGGSAGILDHDLNAKSLSGVPKPVSGEF